MNALFNVYFWFIMFWICGSGVELLPVISSFRKEQAKYPRFTYIEVSKGVDVLLGGTFFGMIISIVMVFACLVRSVSKDSLSDVIGVLVMIPVFVIAKIIEEKITDETKVSWKNLVLLVTLVMEIGSFATTFAFYICMFHSKFESMSDFWGAVLCFSIADVLCLVAVAIGAIGLAMLTKDAADEPKEGVLRYHLKWLPVCNPIVSPVTIPLAIVLLLGWFISRRMIQFFQKIVVKVRDMKSVA
jgi:hypothetical protein